MLAPPGELAPPPRRNPGSATGCVPPALPLYGGLRDRAPHRQRPTGQRPPGQRSLPDRDPSLIETPLDRHPLDRDPSNRDPPDKDPPWTETTPYEQNHRQV